jgi:hypothetical protein
LSEQTEQIPEDKFAQIRKQLADLGPEEKLRLLQALLPSREEREETEEASDEGQAGQNEGLAGRPESDVISAKAFEKGMKFGHAPEVLTQEETPGITENDKARIILRHGNTPQNVMSNMIMLQSYGNIVEAENNLLYDNNEIDQQQFLRNVAAEAFCKLTAGSGGRFEGLKTNIASGKQAHEEIRSEANQKREGRLSRLKRWAEGEKN